MKNLILIAIVCGGIISCKKTTTTTTTTPTVSANSLIGVYTGTVTTYTDEALTAMDGSPRTDQKIEIKSINNKYATILKSNNDTLYLTDVKAFTTDHIAFNLEPYTSRDGTTVAEGLKKYTNLGVSYSGRYQKGTKENLLLYYKGTATTPLITITRYIKFDGNK